MAEKDVKSAKKLYAKMKKAQKAQSRQESPASADKDADLKGDARDQSPAPIEEGSEHRVSSAEPEVARASQSPENAAGEAEGDPAQGASETATGKVDSEPIVEGTADGSSKVEAQQKQEASIGDEAAKTGSAEPRLDSREAASHAGSGAKAPTTEAAESTVESAESSETAQDARVAQPEPDSQLSETGAAQTPRPRANAEQADVAQSRKVANTDSLDSADDSASDLQARELKPAANRASSSSAETIAELRSENDDLKTKIKKLENKVLSLEADLAAARSQHTEVSLSPPSLPQGEDQVGLHRNRASSFVEADLYSESEKVSDRREQMKKWKGFLLDLRDWRRPLGIGEVLTI